MFTLTFVKELTDGTKVSHTLELPDMAEAPEGFGSQYVWRYGLKQSLQDSYAPKCDTEAEFEALLLKRWTAIQADKVREVNREGDPVLAEMTRIARAAITAKIKKNNIKISTVTKDKWAELLQQYFTAHEATLRGEAEANLAKAAEAAADIDLSDLLGEIAA